MFDSLISYIVVASCVSLTVCSSVIDENVVSCPKVLELSISVLVTLASIIDDVRSSVIIVDSG